LKKRPPRSPPLITEGPTFGDICRATKKFGQDAQIPPDMQHERAFSKLRRLLQGVNDRTTSVLEVLVAMGFQREAAVEALMATQNNEQDAIAWLLQNNGESPRNPLQPNEEVIARLVEMGFSEDLVRVAVRCAHNDEQLAAQYLIDGTIPEGDEDSGSDGDSEEEASEDIFSNPSVQQALADERVLNAIQQMVHNPNTVEHFLNDPEIGPLISEIYDLIQSNFMNSI